MLISIDTPGSEINRKIRTDFEISIPRKKLKLGITSPFKTIILDGNLQQMKQLQDYETNLKLIVDDKVYNLDGILKVKIIFFVYLFVYFLYKTINDTHNMMKMN